MTELEEKVLTFAKRSALGGTRSWKIARHYGISTAKARKALSALEGVGRVVRDERVSAVNDIFWRVV